MKTYDDSLAKIDFFKVHPEYMPFIGDKYEEFRILHIGESHYIDQKWSEKGDDDYSITYFQNWLNDRCEDLAKRCGTWYNTRHVIQTYIDGDHRNGRVIFTNMLHVINKIYLGRDNVHINNKQEGENYHYLAFMNFFQMPALYKGMKFWTSLNRSASKTNEPGADSELYYELEKTSVEVVDAVIEILKPKVVIFTSKAAFNVYNRLGKYGSEPYIIDSVHPGCPWWNNPISRFGGKTGRQQLEYRLCNLLNESNR